MPFSNITVLVLSGGKSSRMSGQDKGLMNFNGKPMIQHTLAILSEQFSPILISANQNIDQYQAFGYPVIEDINKDKGPLSGIEAAIKQTKTDYLIITPCDTPLVNSDVFQLLIIAAENSAKSIFVAHDGHQLQMLHALLDLRTGELEQSITEYLKTDRKVQLWYEQNDYIAVDCSSASHAFKNINTPEALKEINN